MDIRLDASAVPQVQPAISYRQIVAVRLLQLPSAEVVMAIERERDDNPAFDVEERQICPRCGAGVEYSELPCQVCGYASGPANDADRGRDEVASYDDRVGGSYEDDGSDPMLRVPGASGRAEGLLQTLRMVCPEGDEEICEFVVGSLDTHGYLPAGIVEDGADMLQCSAARVARVVEALQRLEPVGIGARSACECLLIQLRRVADAGDPRPLAELLVRDFLKDLAFRHFREVAHAIGETPKMIEAEWEFIRTHLNPYPAHGFDPEIGDLSGSAAVVRPDVIIRRKDRGYEAEVVEAQRYDLRVNREYLRARAQAASGGLADQDVAHVRQYVDQAQSFISALRQRWETMQRVADALIDLQRAFLDRGPSGLVPLTRADVARRLDLHESTVSRATDGKFVLLPSGRTVPFDDFFDSSLPVKKALRELISRENARHPFSDEQLRRLLARRGMTIARRTIAKYREEIGILPSRLRRERGVVRSDQVATMATLAGVVEPARVAAAR
ncbi:MAG TPA: hypothetical protein VIC85_20760 [Ktedonobacterales bacterium]|jgi:RNA polymerase sigma-54 factor